MVSKRKTNLNLTTDMKTILNSVFLILLGMSGNFSDKLLGCRLQKLLDTNIYAKHVMLISIIFFTLDFSQKGNVNPLENMKTAIFIWFMVILVNKMNVVCILIACAILGSLYVNNIYIKYYQILNEEDNSQDYVKTIQNLETFDKIMKYVFLSVVVYGSIEYFIKKRTDYKNSWNTLTYIFGVVKCNPN